MRHLARPPLPAPAQRYLQRWTQALVALPAAYQKANSDRTRRQRLNTRTIHQTREALHAMNGGWDRCMYCEHNVAGQIDHFEPRERAPARTFDWPNMVLSCDRCNVSKGSAFMGAGGEPPVDPTLEDPSEHLELSPRDGALVGRTARGEWTIQVFGLNASPHLKRQRREAWLVLQELIVRYRDCNTRGDGEAADEHRQRICDHTFPGVLVQLLNISRDPNPGTVILPDCLRALRDHPEIASWVGPVGR